LIELTFFTPSRKDSKKRGMLKKGIGKGNVEKYLLSKR
jgi:hypothetical protein